MKNWRRFKLTQLLNGPRFNGDRKAFCQQAGITNGRLTQLLDEDEPFGDVAAQNLTESLNLVEDYFGLSIGQLLDKKGVQTIKDYVANPPMLGIHKDLDLEVNVEPAGVPRHFRPTPVVGTAKMGDNGYYEALDYPTGQGDGWVDSYSPDPNAYALRVKGDSMHPAIRHGSFVVVEPNGRCMPGEFVAIVLIDGRKMVKELVIEREHEIVIESVNGNQRQTLERSDIEKMHPIASVVAASKWRQG